MLLCLGLELCCLVWNGNSLSSPATCNVRRAAVISPSSTINAFPLVEYVLTKYIITSPMWAYWTVNPEVRGQILRFLTTTERYSTIIVPIATFSKAGLKMSTLHISGYKNTQWRRLAIHLGMRLTKRSHWNFRRTTPSGVWLKELILLHPTYCCNASLISVCFCKVWTVFPQIKTTTHEFSQFQIKRSSKATSKLPKNLTDINYGTQDKKNIRFWNNIAKPW